jgi:hypothetical protein
VNYVFKFHSTVTMMATLFVASYGSYLVIKTGIAMNKLLLEVYSN